MFIIRRRKGTLALFAFIVAAMILLVVQYNYVFPQFLNYNPPVDLDFSLIHPHLYHNTLTLVPINSGMITMAFNLMCSIARVNPALVSRLTIWAMDEHAVELLQQYRDANEALLLALNNNNNNNSQQQQQQQQHDDLIPVTGFGVFYDTRFKGVPSQEPGASKGYWDMMYMRKQLYTSILQHQVDLLFLDADIVIYEDFWEDLGISTNFSSYRNNNNNGNGGGGGGTDSIYYMAPDVIYSTDARDHYTFLKDPYEKEAYVPKICGGFFFARSNSRALTLYEDLQRANWNDQEGVDKLLNRHMWWPQTKCVALSSPLPTGMYRKFIPDGEECNADNTLRLQILDQVKYANGALYRKYHNHYQTMLDEACPRKRVLVHGNWWGSDKLQDFKNMGLWLIDGNNMCKKP